MEIVNSIKTEVKTTVQGIDVVINTEYINTPSIYTCNVSQQLPSRQEDGVVKWFNVNSILNVETRDVQVNTSGSVPVGFLSALESEMIAAHEFVMAGINAQNVEA